MNRRTIADVFRDMPAAERDALLDREIEVDESSERYDALRSRLGRAPTMRDVIDSLTAPIPELLDLKWKRVE